MRMFVCIHNGINNQILFIAKLVNVSNNSVSSFHCVSVLYF